MRIDRTVALTSVALLGLLWIAGPATAQHGHTQPGAPPPPPPAAPLQEKALKVGKTGDVQFRSDTMVGDLMLKPGRYLVQHRTEGADHFVYFTELAKSLPYSHGGGQAATSHPGEVRCMLTPLDDKVRSTTVYTTKQGETVRVTKVLIAGENVAHVF